MKSSVGIRQCFRVCSNLVLAFLSTSASAALDQQACARLWEAHVLSASAPVGCAQLALVRFPYIDFNGVAHHDGELMVLAAVAPEVSQLFHVLYQRRFPVARARLIEHYQGNDAASMADNNTSAFNHRPVHGASLPSLHAYGLAIDINPMQNPYVQVGENGMLQVSPPAGTAYLNRLAKRPGKPARKGMAEEVVQLFAEAGFTVWGGHWDSPLDYQHFQFNRGLAEQLAALPEARARQLFLRQMKPYRSCLRQQSTVSGTSCALNKAQ